MSLFKWFKAKQNTSEDSQIDFTELLKSLPKSSVRISYDENFNGVCPISSSKIGGKPDLPLNFQWYYYQGKSYEETIASLPPGAREYINREDAQYNSALPLSFIAQINLEEAHEYDKDKLLPPTGMLYFFYELATMTWGDISSKGGARVYYYSGDISKLQRTDFPSDLNDEYKLPEMPITFSTKLELPDYEEFYEWRDEYADENGNYYTKYYDKYEEAINKIGIASEYDTVENARINKLLGYANLVQSGMLLECEAATCGIELYSGKGGYSKKLTKEALSQLKKDCTKWRLLFQLESITTKDYEMLWGDVGRIYYYINIEDLNKQNFDNCWLILQCG